MIRSETAVSQLLWDLNPTKAALRGRKPGFNEIWIVKQDCAHFAVKCLKSCFIVIFIKILSKVWEQNGIK